MQHAFDEVFQYGYKKLSWIDLGFFTSRGGRAFQSMCQIQVNTDLKTQIQIPLGVKIYGPFIVAFGTIIFSALAEAYLMFLRSVLDNPGMCHTSAP